MAKEPNNFAKWLSLILLLNAFIFISTGSIEYDGSTITKEVEYPSTTNQYTVSIKNTNFKYLKITVTPYKDLATPSLCYSNSNANCEEGRIVMASRGDKKPVIAFVKRNEIKSTQFYIVITCASTSQKFTITIEGSDKCKIGDATVYSYQVTDDNKEMEFEFSGLSDQYTLMNLGIEGSFTARLKLDSDYEDINIYQSVYDKSSFISYPIKEDHNQTAVLVSFRITNAKKGEYIRLSAYTYKHGDEDINAQTADNFLYPGGPTISGVLYRHQLYYEEICFPVSAMGDEYADTSRFYLTGVIYSKYADFWMADENDEYLSETEIEITNGILSLAIEPNRKKRSICFEFYGSYYEQTIKQSDVAFSIALVPAPYKKTGNFYHINPPQLIGLTQPYMLPKDKTLLYHAATISKDRYSFFLYNRKGATKMYVTDCDNYANCNYDMADDEVLESMELVENSGKFNYYEGSTETGWDALAKNKKVIIVTCLDDGNDSKGYCEFDLSIYNNNSTITLVENQNLAQFVSQGQTGSYQIFYKGAVELLSVAVEIMIHSGEATFKGDFSPDYYPEVLQESLGQYQTATTYILSNKVFIYFDLKRYPFDALYVKYKAIKNTFFTIKYHDWRADAKNEFLDEIIFPGESYLLAINPDSTEKYTVARVENNRYKAKRYFMSNFFAVNCEFKVLTNKTKGETEITFADGYAQDILGDEEGNFYSKEYYDYKISIEEEDKSKYDKKMCMIYVAGYHTTDLYTMSSILTGSNVNQQIIFDKDKFRTIRFLFEHTDFEKSLIVYANIIDRAFYYIQISINQENNIYKRQVITRSYPYYISKSDLQAKCKDTKSFCNIFVTVEFVADTPGMSRTNPMVEITVREATPKGENELLRVPSYIQKNIAKKDFTTGDGYYYLYTDIGEGDEGQITVNFLRDFGEVYGRIVRRDVKDKVADKDIEWMDLYRLPNDGYEEDRNKYDTYLQKFLFNSDDTADCAPGCYLILGIRISQVGEWAEDYKFYPFTIITLIGPNSASTSDASVVTIQVEDFIIGNVDISSNIKLKQFYQVWLPRNAEYVQIDWQSELAGLYINIDGEKPITTATADFTLIPNGKDSIFVIKRDDIRQKAKEKNIKLPYDNSLEDVQLIIGIWTDKTDSADTELYSLRVRETGFYDEDTEYEVDVIEVNTDEKIMCKPVPVKDGYRCLFMITYDDQDVAQKMDLLVYTASTNLGAKNEIFANFVYARLFNEYNVTELEKNIPSQGRCDYDSTRDDFTYLYIQLADRHKDQYLFVNIKVDTPDDVMMVASINSYDIENGVQVYFANARTEQIVQVKERKMILTFQIEANLHVTIEDLGGEADVYWSNDFYEVHNLRGKGDRLTLTTSSPNHFLTISRVASDKNNKEGKDPGFVFMVNYYTRDPKVNFDEVTYGNSIEIGYRDTDLPVFLYSKISDYSTDINLAVTFRDSNLLTEGEYNSAPIQISAVFDTRNKIYDMKTNPDFVPSDGHTIYGSYDPAIKTAQVFISDVTINSFDIDAKDYPTLLLYIDKEVGYKDRKYEKFNIESQFTRTNSLVVPTQKVYNYGKFNGLVTQYYRLKVDKNKPIMKIVLSFNGNLLSWTISSQPSSRLNDTDINIDAVEARGKITITLKSLTSDFIYLNIFKTDYMEDPLPFLQNYVFKYINVEDESKYFDYTIVNNNGTLDYKEEKVDGQTKLTCTFNRINLNPEQANVTYFFKIINSDYFLGENIKTIALSQSQYYSKFKRNPTYGSDNKISIDATGDFSSWTYLQIIAAIQSNKVLEYVAYDGIYKKRESKNDEPNDGSDNTGLFIGISVTLAILIIGLVAVVVYFQQKNKSLLNQVKHVSFQQQGNNATPDLLLAKSQGA